MVKIIWINHTPIPSPPHRGHACPPMLRRLFSKSVSAHSRPRFSINTPLLFLRASCPSMDAPPHPSVSIQMEEGRSRRDRDGEVAERTKKQEVGGWRWQIDADIIFLLHPVSHFLSNSLIDSRTDHLHTPTPLPKPSLHPHTSYWADSCESCDESQKLELARPLEQCHQV